MSDQPEPTSTPARAEQPELTSTSAKARRPEDAAATRAAERLFSLLRERATENPDHVALLERLGRAFDTRNAPSPPDTEAPS